MTDLDVNLIKNLDQQIKNLSATITDLEARTKSMGTSFTSTIRETQRLFVEIDKIRDLTANAFKVDEKNGIKQVDVAIAQVANKIQQTAADKRNKLNIIDTNQAVSDAKKTYEAVLKEYQDFLQKSKRLQSQIVNMVEPVKGMSASQLRKVEKHNQEALSLNLQTVKNIGITPESISLVDRFKDAYITLHTAIQNVTQSQIALQNKLNGGLTETAAKLNTFTNQYRGFTANKDKIEQNLANRLASLQVQKLSGIIDDKTFNEKVQAILNGYDTLIRKKKEFDSIGNLDKASEKRQTALRNQQKYYGEIKKAEDEIENIKRKRSIREKQYSKDSSAETKKNLDALYNAEEDRIKFLEKRIRELGKARHEAAKVSGVSNSSEAAKGTAEGESAKREAQSLNNLLTAERRLEEQRQRDADRQHRRQMQAARDFNTVTATVRKLAAAFGLTASLRGLTEFAKKIVEVRGQFEMQFVAMKQIIGDVDEATKIWNQTMQQALKSPFTAMQLTDYTKKLAAYRIENEKLFDTTKRLADVSAGLGVDMGRLILAYGQVKTANFLRASEVRQFTEAGVNIYDNLARYFSEIEGRAVSAAEVVERVTKRMVIFSDVEEIFKRMTDEGGVFFNMQEVQSDTVRGQIMKLRDAYDQMLNKIGQENQGELRNFIETLNRLVRNWRDVASFLKMQIPILATAIPYWIALSKWQKMSLGQQKAYEVQIKRTNYQLQRHAAAVRSNGLILRGLRSRLIATITHWRLFNVTLRTTMVTMHVLGSLFKSFAPLLAIEAILYVINKLGEATRKAKEFQEELNSIENEQFSRGEDEAAGYKKLVAELENANKNSIERRKIIQQINQQYGSYLDKLYSEDASLKDVADGYKLVATRAREAARARSLKQGSSSIMSKYNQERTDLIYDISQGVRQGVLLSDKLTLSKQDARNFSEYVDVIVSKNKELYESMSQAQRLLAITDLYKEYFGEKLHIAAADTFVQFIDNTINRLNTLENFESGLAENFDLAGLTKKQREILTGVIDAAKETQKELEKASKGDTIEMPLGLKLEVKETSDKAGDIISFVQKQIQDEAKKKEILVKFDLGIIGEVERDKLMSQIGKLTDPLAQEINERVTQEIKEAYGYGDLGGFGEAVSLVNLLPWTKEVNDMYATINTSLLRETDLVQGIGKAEEFVALRLSAQLKTISDINQQKQRGSVTDKDQLEKLLQQEKALKESYKWLERTVFLLKRGLTTKESSLTLLDEETIEKAKQRVKDKFGENVAIKVGFALDYASTDKLQSEVAEAYHKAGDSINAEIEAMKNSANPNKERMKELEQQRDIQYEIAKAYGYVAKERQKSEQKESVSRMISLLKEMNSDYEKLSKSAYGYAKSQKTVEDSYRSAFMEIYKGLGMKKGEGMIIDFDTTDFTTKSGVIAALEQVLDYVRKNSSKYTKDAVEQLEKEISQIKTDIGVDVQLRLREDFGRKMEEAFGNYELTLELQKLNLPKGVAADMWGIEEIDLSQLRAKMDELYQGLKDENGQVNADALQAYENNLKKIDDLERKQQRERLKDYAKYIEAQYSDRVKLEMEYVRKVAALEAESAIPQDQRLAIRAGLDREYNEAVKKQDWEDFKGSEFYVQMMEDLEKQGSASLNVMREKLEEMRKNAENLSPRALKEVVNALEKIDDIERGRTRPLERLNKAINELKGVDIKATYEQLAVNQKDLATQEEKKKQLEEMIMLENERNRLEEQGVTIEEARISLSQKQNIEKMAQKALSDFKDTGDKTDIQTLSALQEAVNKAKSEREAAEYVVQVLTANSKLNEQAAKNPYRGKSISELNEEKKALEKQIKETQENINAQEKLVNIAKELQQAWYDTLEGVKDYAQRVGSVFEGVTETVDYFADSTNSLAAEWREFGSASVSALTDLVSGIQAYMQANAEAEKATGLLTGNGLKLALVILGVIIKIVQAIAKANDAAIDKEIERSRQRVDELSRAYERLEKSIEKTLKTANYMSDYNKQLQNIRQQIAEAESQMNAAQGYKDKDKKREALRDAEDSKQQALDMLDEVQQKQIETFGGIGRDNYRSWAQDFVSAWKDAFLETGDGLDALNEHFDEFLQEWFVKQATMRVAASFLEPYMREIDAAVAQGNVDYNRLHTLVDNIRSSFPELNEILKQMIGEFGLSDTGSLSGLAAGIQGMTEEQANILEAYWNSVRMYTANIDFNVARIAEALGVGGNSPNTNPMLQQITIVAQQTTQINALLSAVSTNNGQGRGIRVYTF